MNILREIENAELVEVLEEISLDDPNATAMISAVNAEFPAGIMEDEDITRVSSTREIRETGKVVFTTDNGVYVITK